MRPHRFADHPFRKTVQDEVHARPVQFVDAPSLVRRVALLLPPGPDAVGEAHRRFAGWCRSARVEEPAGSARQHGFRVAEKRVTWELHTEFVTLTWISPPDDSETWPAGIGLEAFETEELVAAVRIDLAAASELPGEVLAGFRPESLCASRIEGGAAQIATDFVLDADGFTRFELAGGALSPLQRAMVVRHLLEIETYRSFALLALPLARRVSPDLNAAEARLGTLVVGLGTATSTEQAQRALSALHALAVAAGELVEATSYRFAASRAYGDVLHARLRNLGEEPLAAASTLERYLRNRVDPALATCLAVEKRQVALSEKIERATELLNTRISLDIQAQNREVLATIADTARSQYRLQKTVEGLSTIAISYYLLAILSYVLSGIAQLAHLDKTLVIAAAAPFVLAAVYVVIRSIRNSVR